MCDSTESYVRGERCRSMSENATLAHRSVDFQSLMARKGVSALVLARRVVASMFDRERFVTGRR
jgi:hypothetical protein